MKAECVTLETATLEAPPRRENIVTTRLGVRVGLKSPLPSRGATSPMAWRGFSSSLAGALVLPVEAVRGSQWTPWTAHAAACAACAERTVEERALKGLGRPRCALEKQLERRSTKSGLYCCWATHPWLWLFATDWVPLTALSP
ncbi:hypothetical protein PF001_g13880 [Phytophthora fragariae]|uniref:Uncharacterized protein n=1 Tax=Phytophthora fragariae TaxID=53985 RepID=A0A6A4DA69_9STRA|nr:hypothetical protein PF001_g13880 [Phytophthora fragariae]